MENKQKRQKNNKKKNAKIIIFSIIAVLLIIVVFVLFFTVKFLNDIKGINQPDIPAVVVVPEGSTGADVAEILENADVIESAFVFRLYIKQTGIGAAFRAGEHEVNSNMSYGEIIKTLEKGGVQVASVRITFVEGETLWQMAKKLEDKGVCSAKDFIKVLQTHDFDYDFVKEISDSELRYLRLEGYLFPDTYDFIPGEAPETVADRFLKNFDKKITPEIREQAKAMGYSIDQMLTLASVIQSEASNPVNMGPVSSVFANRLAEGSHLPKLQSDVTAFYGRDYIVPNVEDEKKAEDISKAYNTYFCTGLPVGPICNPGIEAIKAAVNPSDTPYYYFVTDINAKYYYAITFDEHQKNIDDIKRNNLWAG